MQCAPGRMPLLDELRAGLRTLELAEPHLGAEHLLEYVGLLSTWNKAYSLTALDDPHRVITRHLLDSLSIAPFLEGQRLLDIGSGAGLPGIPLAVWFPEREFHLLDSNGKKTRFLFEAIRVLQLKNAVVHHSRAEDFRDAKGFDTILSRAVGSLGELVSMSGHLLAAEGRFVAMKAEVDEQELRGVRAPYNVAACVKLSVPGIARQRQLVCITRSPARSPMDGSLA